MSTASKVVGVGLTGLFLAGAGAVVMMSFGAFSQFMPPLPWVIGIVLLVVALIVGVQSGKFVGIGLVLVWSLGVGLALLLGQGNPAGGPFFVQSMYAAIPWTFVACCAFAIVLNA